MSFKTKLLFAFIVLICFVAVLGVVALASLTAVTSKSTLMYNHPFTVSRNLQQAKLDIITMQRDIMLSYDSTEIETIHAEIVSLNNSCLKHIDTVRHRFLGKKVLVDSTQQHLDEWRVIRDQIIKLALTGNLAEAERQLKNVATPKVAEIFRHLAIIQKTADARAEAFVHEAREVQNRSVFTIIVLTLFLILFGVVISYIIGRNLMQMIGGDPQEISALAEDIASGAHTITPPPIASSTGILKNMLVMLKSIDDANALVKAKTDDLEMKNAELEQYTYIVSHDLKSPLITIKGFLGYVLQDLENNKPERVAGDLKRIGAAADKMGILLEDLLMLSRVGRQANPSHTFNMSDAAHDALELLHGVITEKRVAINLDEKMPQAYGDRARIAELFQNLIENAIKYMGDQPTPAITIGYRQNDERTVYFVNDNGKGIAETYHKKIFGLFDKLDPTSSGSGIGLAMVKRIVDYHHGSVWVESQGPGTGSCFCFTLTLQEYAQLPKSSQSATV